MAFFSRIDSQARRRSLIAALFAFWAVAIVAGMTGLIRFDQTAGAAASAPAHWPRGTSIARDDGRSTLLVFLHPRCDCSDATLSELEAITGLTPTLPSIHIVWLHPAQAGDAWRDTPTRHRVDAWSLLAQHEDDGTEAVRFGAQTSGQVLYYDTTGTLRFAGGITGARGRIGDNPGRRHLLEAIAGNPGVDATEVFGCPLHAHADARDDTRPTGDDRIAT